MDFKRRRTKIGSQCVGVCVCRRFKASLVAGRWQDVEETVEESAKYERDGR